LIFKEVYTTTAGKVSVPVLLQFLQKVSISAKGMYRRREGVDRALGDKYRDKSAMTVKSEKNIIAGISISDFLFLGCLS